MRRRWWPLLLCYPLAMTFTLVYAGEHYVIDVLVGWVYVGLAFRSSAGRALVGAIGSGSGGAQARAAQARTARRGPGGPGPLSSAAIVRRVGQVA